MNQSIVIDSFESDVGRICVAATQNGLCLLGFENKKNLKKDIKDIERKFKVQFVSGSNRHTQKAKSEFQQYLKGKTKKFTVSLDPLGTEFQKKVWKTLEKIPYGKTWSYKKQSIKLNNPNAIRAVARANGQNHIAVIIPCHRVIGSNGSLTGYASGLKRKKWLLDLESKS